MLISAVVQNKDGGEGRGHSDERMRWEFGVWREGGSIWPVQSGREGLALCQAGQRAHEEAVCG